jgi:hypothetical protein
MRARRTWLALFRIAIGAARERGWRQAGGEDMPGAGINARVVDLDSEEPIPGPELDVPVLVLDRAGESLGRVFPRRAQWPGALAEGAAGVLAGSFWPERENRWWTRLPNASAAITPEPADAPRESGRVIAGVSWEAADQAIRLEAGFVAVLLPGVAASDDWVRWVAPAFEASRVACVVGAGLYADEPPPALVIHSRSTLPTRYASGLGKPFQYIAVNPRIYDDLGGFDLDAAALGDYAPVLDFIDRALEAGYVIGYRDTPGLTPAGSYRPERTTNEWQRWSATGALLVRSAQQRGGVIAWLYILGRSLDGVWTRLIAGESRRWWIGSRLALVSGAVQALRR